MRIAKTLFSAIVLLNIGAGLARGDEAISDEETPYWEDLKAIVFEDRLMLNGDEWIDANIPLRTENDLRQVLGARVVSPDETAISKVYFVIDENPMPVSLTLEPVGVVTALDFDATFRVNRPTNSHVVLELADGRLFVEENYIKTSGVGACSSPPISDPKEAEATMGDMVLAHQKADGNAQINGRSDPLKIGISHPQNSGMQKDQVTLLFIPARYVTALQIDVNAAPWMAMEGSISLSEDPDIRVGLPENASDVKVRLIDSDGLEKQAELSIN